ncbi:MAG: hypothetical protein A3I77_03175 [Gammaproteobacteria bacterium RIFCSPLOWO2_02_FULL_42_14]|nr:MAG: hypothetical protein A3B71_01155 [Gammaproteobacteria bacterium RIFCSPHIGHO2_02_FULL_42_43]OGT28802.1 MAG: hypothetical protein A2624_01445 [Gammaproteobacteria bacterium RIFCSPHIGHO2_01_FULL_42_8]OGT51674.1 MAG: hypothetical protein A3E54_03370 [Gammaproteobacteria bacterium RIFCSPHIGHO2_12_FULL_41_25]OGT61572.1 MAG: hypothetical protein A3I77_03175 [Gammaproteobacteria bacterium RIFCSPLOWO2_02_FULL_42_14]OGT86195.1 MAG: hypothetical protein A3G86_06025 [Gammaproteobacteria bacterium R
MKNPDIIRCVWDEPCILGEAPIWHPFEKVLYWVDILKPKLHRLDVKNNAHQSWTMPSDIACISPLKNSGLIAAFKDGVAILNPVSNHVTYLDNLPKDLSEQSVFNDGHCDRQGRFWIGSKNPGEVAAVDPLSIKSAGEIYRFDMKNKLVKQAGDFIVTNGLVFSLDSKYFFVANSPKRIIYRYEFDSETGAIYNPIVFAKIADDAGVPDGMTFDAQGYLWNCHFGGWRITRYSPDGKIDRVIKMPVGYPTSCCLGGPDLKTLFITSAKRDVTESELINQPKAGALFAIDVDVPGVAESCFLES